MRGDGLRDEVGRPRGVGAPSWGLPVLVERMAADARGFAPVVVAPFVAPPAHGVGSKLWGVEFRSRALLLPSRPLGEYTGTVEPLFKIYPIGSGPNTS